MKENVQEYTSVSRPVTPTKTHAAAIHSISVNSNSYIHARHSPRIRTVLCKVFVGVPNQ